MQETNVHPCSSKMPLKQTWWLKFADLLDFIVSGTKYKCVRAIQNDTYQCSYEAERASIFLRLCLGISFKQCMF